MNFGLEAPEKTGYKFNEITSLTGVKPYVLRFWETEFSQISPVVNESGQKLYDKSDLLAVKTIKKLLFEDKLSIPEARAVLSQEMEAIMNTVAEEESSIAQGELQKQSLELKQALESIVHQKIADATPSSEERKSGEGFASKAGPLASRIKRELKSRERSLNDRDVVSLVSAKKKLTKLLGVIQELENRKGWN